jgi:hypothetical protein
VEGGLHGLRERRGEASGQKEKLDVVTLCWEMP